MSEDHLSSHLPAAEVLRHVVDVHCHPTDTEIQLADMNSLPVRICAMASRRSDQNRVAELARSYPDKVIPAFGYHPWFSHLISLDVVPDTPEAKEAHYRSLFIPDGSKDAGNDAYIVALLNDLPHPLPLPHLLTDIREHLAEFLLAHQHDPTKPKPMLGEVGLDRSFRVPFTAYGESERPKPEDGPNLTPFPVPIEHQQRILEAQLNVAVDLGVNVSLHSVKAPAQTLEVFKHMVGKSFDAISIDMHSCGVSVSTWKDIQNRHPNVFMSLSTGINFRSEAHRELIKACADNRILVESDMPRVNECAPRTWAMLCRVAELKGWTVEEEWNDLQDSSTGAVHRLEDNWRAFEKAGFVRKPTRAARRKGELAVTSENES